MEAEELEEEKPVHGHHGGQVLVVDVQVRAVTGLDGGPHEAVEKLDEALEAHGSEALVDPLGLVELAHLPLLELGSHEVVRSKADESRDVSL